MVIYWAAAKAFYARESLGRENMCKYVVQILKSLGSRFKRLDLNE